MPFSGNVTTLTNAVGGIVFRDDYEYYLAAMQDSQVTYAYNPFEAVDLDTLPNVNIYCREIPKFVLPVSVYVKHEASLNLVSMANPLVISIIADYLTLSINREQLWSRYHYVPKEHPMQQYLSLRAIITTQLPHLLGLYTMALGEIEDSKTTFMNQVIQSNQTYKPGLTNLDNYAQSIEGISDAYLETAYEARGKSYELVVLQDIWDHPDVQDFLQTVEVTIARTIGRHTRVENIIAELACSHRATRAHDVYFCHAVGNRLVIKNLGDYRVLNWELSNA